jgi:tetrahydrofolate synthase
LEEQDLGDYQKVASYREFLDGFESSVGEKELLFVTGSLYFISEVRAYLMGYESID